MTEQTAKTHEGREFFYYPGISRKKPRRIVLAGFVVGNQILVAESVTYPGKNPTLLGIEEVETNVGTGVSYTYLLDGRPGDSFSKKGGRKIALDRVRGYYYDTRGKKGVNYIKGTYTAEDGTVGTMQPIPCKTSIVMSIDIPEGEQYPGRVFVREVEKVYPPKVRKPMPTFTIAEIKQYLQSIGIMPVGENLEEAIRQANERRGEPAPE